MKDYLIKGYAFDGTVRIYAATTTNLCEEARKIHDLWPTSAVAFSRSLTASIIMGSMYGIYNDSTELTIRLEANGPLGGIIINTNTKGEVKGYVGNPHVFMQNADGSINVSKSINSGMIHVTKDLKVKEMFTSSSQLQTGEIAEDFAYYFTTSEQVPSAVALGEKIDENNKVEVAGGLILQIMPGCKVIDEVEQALKNLPNISDLLQIGKTPEEIAKIIDPNLEVLETLDLSYKCNCSKEKFEKGLISLGTEELTTILEEDGKMDVTCHFCKTNYNFNKLEIKELIKLTK